jgi:hypothetical protein
VHKAWIVVEAHNKEEARNTLPVLYRRQATVVELNRFSLDELDDLITRHHGGSSSA